MKSKIYLERVAKCNSLVVARQPDTLTCKYGVSAIEFALSTAALAQTRADLAAGRSVQESPEAHLARLDAM